MASMSRLISIQGRQLSPGDIKLIRQLIFDNPTWHRTRLSRELCQMWNWRTDNGLLKDMACRSMLRKLDDQQLIALPPAKRAGSRPRHILDIAHSKEPIETSLAEIRPIQIVSVAPRCQADDLFFCLMHRYHYLGCRGHVGQHLKYMVYDKRHRPLACLLFGSPAWKTAPRDRFIGWDPKAREANLKLMTNNTRFLILPWVRVVNLASFTLGACMRRINTDWKQRYGNQLCLVETFVDRVRFRGTCYQAANWIHVGHTQGRSRQDRHHRLHVSVKDTYLYPLSAHFRKQLCTR